MPITMEHDHSYPALEMLDKKHGRVHTVADWQRASSKVFVSPADLTDDDIALIRAFDGEKRAADASQRRQKALPPTPTPAPLEKQQTARDLSDPDLELKALLSRHGHEPVSLAMLDGTIDALQEGLRDAFQKHQDARRKLEARVAGLEAEIAALKQRPDFHDAGPYREGATYSKGAFVTRRGYWLCLTDKTLTAPGTSSAWRLVVKESKPK
jgi:hypothetical protein